LKKTPLILATICFALAVVIFALADGPRRIYSAIFLVVIGLVMMANARRKTS